MSLYRNALPTSSRVYMQRVLIGLACAAGGLLTYTTDSITFEVLLGWLVIFGMTAFAWNTINEIYKVFEREVKYLEAAPQIGTGTLEAATGAVQGRAITGSNIVVVSGMVVSSTFLLLNANDLEAGGFLTLAPKAFAATGFAVAASMVVTWFGQQASNAVRTVALQTVKPSTDDPNLILHSLVDKLTQLEKKLQLPPYPEIIVLLQSIQLGLPGANGSPELVAAITAQTQELGRLIQMIAPMQEASRENQNMVSALLQLSTHVPKLVATQTDMKAELEKLNLTLGPQTDALLERYLSNLKEVSVGLAKDWFIKLDAAASEQFQTHLNKMLGTLEQEVSAVYQKAYKDAAERMVDTLHRVRDETTKSVDGFSSLETKMASFNLNLSSLNQSFEVTAQSTQATIKAYNKAIIELSEVLKQLEADTQKAEGAMKTPGITQFVKSLNEAGTTIHDASNALTRNLRTLQENEQRLKKAREVLIQHLQPNRQN